MKRFLPMLVVGIGLIMGAKAEASLLMIGTNDGVVFGRSEYDLATHIPSSYITFGPGVVVTTLSSDAQGNVAVGTNVSGWIDVSTRPASNLSVVITSLNTGNGIMSAAAGSTGQLVLGDADGLLFQRQMTDLLAYPPGYTPPDGYDFGSPISAVTVLQNGNVVFGTESGLVVIRSGNNLAAFPPGTIVGSVNFGEEITSLAVDSNGQIVIGLIGGLVTVRTPEDLTITTSSVNFGTSIRAICPMLDDTVAIGLANGQVSLRETADLTINLQTVTFDGSAVTAISYSLDGNLGIGTALNSVFVRQGDNLLALPVGYVGADGLNFGAPITALTFAVPEPSTVVSMLAGLFVVAVAQRRKRLSLR